MREVWISIDTILKCKNSKVKKIMKEYSRFILFLMIAAYTG